MLRRLTLLVTGVCLPALVMLTVVPVGGASPAAGDSALNIPDNPAGEVTGTASADPAGYPYLQLMLTRPAMLHSPYESVPGIEQAPVANPGGLVDISVPSWGLGGSSTAVFALLGCSTSEAASCTTLLASVQRTITQTAPATAVIDRPDGTLILPDETITATANNTGGGRISAVILDAGFNFQHRLELPDDTPTDLTGYFDNPRLGVDSLTIQRCSVLVSSSWFCEPALASSTVRFLRKVVTTTDAPTLRMTMNPEWWSSSQLLRTSTYTLGLPLDLTWELRDAAGQVLIAPQQVVASEYGSADIWVSPERHFAVLPDGTYTLVLAATAHKGDLALTNTTEVELQVFNDPPADHPQVLSARRTMRPGAHNPINRAAHFTVDGYPDPKSQARLILTDGAGRDVAHQFDVHHEPCTNVGGYCDDPYSFDIDPHNDTGDLLRPGTYTARLVMPDSWGRLITRPLGEVYMQALRVRTRTVTAAPTKLREPGTRIVGRCSSLRAGGPRRPEGALVFASGSRCDDRRGDADLVRHGFTVPLPTPAGLEKYHGITVSYSSAMLRPGIAKVACLPAHRAATWSRRRVDRAAGWHTACTRHYPSMWDPARPGVRLRFSTSDGARLAVDRIRIRVDYLQWYTPQG